MFLCAVQLRQIAFRAVLVDLIDLCFGLDRDGLAAFLIDKLSRCESSTIDHVLSLEIELAITFILNESNAQPLPLFIPLCPCQLFHLNASHTGSGS